MSKKLFMNLVLSSLMLPQLVAKPVLMNSQKRLTFQVAKEGLNRIKILDDRIESVYGDDHAFVSEADAKTGQLFFRVRPESGSQPIFLTLLTEEGLDQDLKLIPTKTAAKTIVLRPHDYTQQDDQFLPSGLIGEGTTGSDRIEWMRKLVMGNLQGQPCNCCSHDDQRPYSQFKSCLIVRINGRVGHALHFKIKNNTEQPLHLKEEQFFKEGDTSIAISKAVLQPGAKTDLFILKVGECHG